MFTLISIGLIALVTFYLDKQQSKDNTDTADIIRHIRQDTRLMAYLLAAVVIMLGIIADRIP